MKKTRKEYLLTAMLGFGILLLSAGIAAIAAYPDAGKWLIISGSALLYVAIIVMVFVL